MSQTQNEELSKYSEQLADEVLDKFDKIAKAATNKLDGSRTFSSDSLAPGSAIGNALGAQKQNRIHQDLQTSYRYLQQEPAIARVVVANEAGKKTEYYICRGVTVSNVPGVVMVNRNAKAGTLASLPVGEEFEFPDGNVVEIIEHATLQPNPDNGWDSINTVVETENLTPFTITSMRALLTEAAEEDITEDFVGQLLAENALKSNIIDGIVRNVITKMSLRDRAILDQHQDAVFRLPLNSRLLLLGPPGTGKTTTLIRRLGQKLDTETDSLDADEKLLIEQLSIEQGIDHTKSWLMFTPTELLKQYIKEAFAREDIPAPDQRLKTWHDYRRELAQQTFGILHTPSDVGSGKLVLKNALCSLHEDAEKHPIEWFEDFNAWQRNTYVQDLHDAATVLCDAKDSEVANLGASLQETLSQAGGGTLASVFGGLAAEIEKVQTLADSLKESTDAKIKAVLNLQVKRNRKFLDELALEIDRLKQELSADANEQDDLDADEEYTATAHAHTDATAAINAYMQAIRAQARAVASKRPLSKTSRNGKIISWIANRALEKADYAEIGASLLVQSNARRFVNPVKRYFDGITRRYRAFRRERQRENRWYLPEGFEAREIHALELDMVLLAILRTGGELLSRDNIRRNIDKPVWSSLQPIRDVYRNQILVDEATDFSPIQLANMAALAHPRLRSFFACGDFNQRLTTWGARSSDDLKWIFADTDFEIRNIETSYRQSKQLNELAHAIISATGADKQNASLPKHMNSDGFAPALLEHASSTKAVINWLASRIVEIWQRLKQLPSIAIFVNTEDDITPIADELKEALAEFSIPVTPCNKGQAMGQDDAVRVFDIQHIKGLEFEAVFFIHIDQLEKAQPALFDKYLYVGATRAATYLGVTCEGSLPASIESLRTHFRPDFSKVAD